MQKTIVMSLYTMGRDSKYFTDPESFRPERWLRNGDKKNCVQEPLAFIPFGVGVRSCIGRRVAEMQMQFLLSRVSLVSGTLNHPDLESLLLPRRLTGCAKLWTGGRVGQRGGHQVANDHRS